MSARQQIAESCAKLGGMFVDQNCVVAPPTPVVATSSTDMLSASIAAQSNAMAAQANNITIFATILAIFAIVVAIGGGWLVKMWAEQSARDAVNEWMAKNAYTEFAKVAGELIPGWMDGTERRPQRHPLTQDQIEEGLVGDPTEDP